MTDDPMKLLAEVRSLFVDLNTCYPHERRVITDIDRYLATERITVTDKIGVDDKGE